MPCATKNMQKIVGIAGLLVCILQSDEPFSFNEKTSMLLEKIVGSNAALVNSLKRIEQKLDSLILGDIEAARNSFTIASSVDLTEAEKVAEIVYARRQLIKGYERCGSIESLCFLKAQLASEAAVCFYLENKNNLATDWFVKAKKQYILFNTEIKEKNVAVLETSVKVFKSKWKYAGLVLALFPPAYPILLTAGAADLANDFVGPLAQMKLETVEEYNKDLREKKSIARLEIDDIDQMKLT
jgi:hypothetical protein